MKTISPLSTCFSHHTYPVLWESWLLDILGVGGTWKILEFHEEDCLMGVWLYWEKKKLGISYITMPPAIKYMGPAIDQKLSQAQKKHVYDALALMLPPTAYYVQQYFPWISSGIITDTFASKIVERDTYLWDISHDIDTLRKQMDGNYRRAIRKYEEQEEGDFRPKGDVDEIQDFIQLLIDSMGSLESHGLSKKILRRLIESAESRSKGRLIPCYYDGIMISASFIVWDRHQAYYLFAGNHSAYRHLYPGVLAAWQTALYLRENTSVTVLDMYGSSIESIAKVWKKLGAERVSYSLVESNPNPLVKMMQWGRNRWRKK